MAALCYRRHRFPPEIIQHAIWFYLRFTLSYRDVEELLAERGLEISYETVRRWVLKFGPAIARRLRQRRPRQAIVGTSTRWSCGSPAGKRDRTGRLKTDVALSGDRGLESISSQRRVTNEPKPTISQQIGVGALLQQSPKAHHLIGHRRVLGSRYVLATKYPTGDPR